MFGRKTDEFSLGHYETEMPMEQPDFKDLFQH